MEFEVAIYQLSAEFIRNYPSQQYPELMYKKGRPYSCLLIDLHLDYFVCVPYRSSIHHKNAFFFLRDRALPPHKVRTGLLQDGAGGKGRIP